MRAFEIGDRVVYKMGKVSRHPGARARDVYPSLHGEDYFYIVPKFWRVASVPDPEHVVAVTRTGKRHQLSVRDPRLHKATLLERLWYRDRFPPQSA